MGGINCPPPDREVPLSPEVTEEYVKSLAVACRHLFDGIAKFYAANAQIEIAILTDGNLRPTLDQLEGSTVDFTVAQAEFGTFFSLCASIGVETDMDPSVQLERFGDIADKIRACRQRLNDIDDSIPLQEALWGDESLRRDLADLIDQISEATTWHTQFAASDLLVV